MKKTTIFAILCLLLSSSAALANKPSKIELNDGSVIVGEITGVNNGTYSINSSEMGILQINEQNIKQIGFLKPAETLNSTTSSNDENISNSKMETLRNKLMGDKETMGMIMSLQNDPQFLEVLQDPAILGAVQSGNTAALMNNEKFMQLKDNLTVQKIKDRATE